MKANAIPGVDYVESTTTSGESIVTAWMKLNENSTDALAELSSGLSQIRLELPDGAEDPFIEVSRADSPYASFYLAVRVPETRPLGEVTDIVQRDIVPQLTSVDRALPKKYMTSTIPTPLPQYWKSTAAT